MNIWIVDHYSSEPCFGGISRQYDFANSLSAHGYNVLVIASSFSHYHHKYIIDGECTIREINPLAHFAYLKTIPYKNNAGLKRGVFNLLSFVIAIKKNRNKLANQFGKPDVVVGCSQHPFAWIAAQKAAKYFKARFLAEVRDFIPQTWIDDEGKSPYSPRSIFFGLIEKWAYSKAEKIIYSMSKGDKYIGDVLGFPKEKLIWIDQPLFTSAFDKNALRYGELPKDVKEFIGDSFLCVFTGYYKDYEGVYEMLDAAKILLHKKLPIKFVFFGSGDAKESMIKFREENHLSNTFIGNRISKELIPALLRRANVCLVHLAMRNNPNSWKYDASKNKVNEYMYSDSIIVYGTYQKNHIVEKSGAGICIEPFNGDAFADTIEEIYNMSPEKRKTFGENARKYVLENNTLEVLTQRYISILEKK